MSKYSSDSDSEKRGNKRSYKSNSRRRSSSSESSDSRSRYKKNKSSTSRRRHSRSRSTDRYSRNRSDSYHRLHKSKSYRGSHSKESSRSRRSTSRDRYHRSYSRDNRSRRSRSRSYIKEYVSKKRSSSSSSSCSSSSSSSTNKRKKEGIKSKQMKNPQNGDEGCVKIDLTKEPDLSVIDNKLLHEINEDSFTQKPYSSTTKSKPLQDTIVIDLKKQTIKVPQVEPVEPDSIFHHNLFLSEEARLEKWVKELFTYRQKALQQGIK